MNENKRDELLRNHTTIAQKVFTAVPMGAPWTVDQIHMELCRGETVARIDRKILCGCLRTLAESKIIKEAPLNSYCRVAVTPRVGRPPKKEEPVVTNHSKITPDSVVAADPDTGLAKRIKTLAADMKDMSDQAQLISDELLLLSMEVKDRAGDSEKLKQLRTLLSGV